MQPVIGLAETPFSGIKYAVPKSLQATGIETGVPCRRSTTIQKADKPEYSYAGDKKIILQFPAHSNFDTRRSFLMLEVEIERVGGTYARLSQYADCFIDRVRILSQNVALHDQEYYNEISSLLKEMAMDQDVRSTVGSYLGIGTEAERSAWGASPRHYIIPLYGNLLNTENIITKNLAVPLKMELTIGDPTKYIETDGAITNVYIRDVEFYLDNLEFDPSYESTVLAKVANGQTIGFRTWTRNEFNLNGSSLEQEITQKNSSWNGILNVFKSTTQTNDLTRNNKLTTFPTGPTGTPMVKTQLKINSKNFYQDALDLEKADGWIPFQIYCRWMQYWKLNGMMQGKIPITQANFHTDKCIQIDDFEAYPEELDLVNGFNTMGPNTKIMKRYEFSGPVPANWVVHAWVESFQITTLMSDGTVRTTM